MWRRGYWRRFYGEEVEDMEKWRIHITCGKRDSLGSGSFAADSGRIVPPPAVSCGSLTDSTASEGGGYSVHGES